MYVGETKFRSSEGYNAKENAKEFIKKFFPEKQRSTRRFPVKDYRDELKNDESRQDKFIKAWSSIEEDFRREIAENSEYGDDAKALIDY